MEVIKGDNRSLDCSSHILRVLRQKVRTSSVQVGPLQGVIQRTLIRIL